MQPTKKIRAALDYFASDIPIDEGFVDAYARENGQPTA
jgi:hypothetical protein